MSISTLRSLSARSRIISTEAACVADRRVSAISQQARKPRALQNHHNYRLKERTMKSFGWGVMSSLAVFLVGMSTSWAQEAAAPPLDCRNDRSVGACVNEVLVEQDGMITDVEDMLNVLQDTGMFFFAQEQFGLAAQGAEMPDLSKLFARIDTLRNDHARAKEANDATEDSEYDEAFEQADAERGKNCKFSDKTFVDSIRDENGDLVDESFFSIGFKPDGLLDANSKFNNNKCDVFTALIHNPGGDDDGMEVRVNERKENMCEKVCKEKTVGGPQRGKSKGRFVDNLLDALDTAQDARRSVSASKARVSELGLRIAEFRSAKADVDLSIATALSSSSSGPTDPCAPAAPGVSAQLILTEVQHAVDLAADIAIIALTAAVVAGNIATEILETISDVIDIASDQVIAGFNVRASQIPFTVGAHLSSGIFGVVDGIINLLDGAKSISGDGFDIAITALDIIDATQLSDVNACSKEIRDHTVELQEEFSGFPCQSDLCVGGPNDGNACMGNSDCDGAIFNLQRSAGETAVALAAIQDELALMKGLLEEIRAILLTPHGKREGFNQP